MFVCVYVWDCLWVIRAQLAGGSRVLRGERSGDQVCSSQHTEQSTVPHCSCPHTLLNTLKTHTQLHYGKWAQATQLSNMTFIISLFSSHVALGTDDYLECHLEEGSILYLFCSLEDATFHVPRLWFLPCFHSLLNSCVTFRRPRYVCNRIRAGNQVFPNKIYTVYITDC